MVVPRPTSSVYSRDEEGIPIEEPPHTSVAPSTRPSLAESEVSSLLRDRMSLLTPRAEGKIQAIASLANRLLFSDGFQLEIIRATRLVHVELRVALAQGLTPETAQKVERCSIALSGILARWTRCNQAMSEDVTTIDFKHDTHKPQEALASRAKILHIPAINGCELNFATAHRLHVYFVDCVASPFQLTKSSTYDLPRIAATAESIQSCFHMVQDRFEDVAFSADQLSRDTVKAWQQVSTIKAEIEEDNIQQEARGDRSSGSKRPFKAMISKFKDHAKRNSKSPTKSNVEDLKPELPSLQIQLGLSEAGKRPRLAVFPPASLPVLERQQKDLQRHHENVRRQSQLSRPGTIRVVSDSSQPTTVRSESRHDSHAVVESPRRPAIRYPGYEQTSNEYSADDQKRHGNNHESVPNRKRIVDQRLDSEADQDIELEELTQLEQEILEASFPDNLSQPDSTEDPEKVKSWWRKRALRDLEAGGDAEGEVNDSAGEEEEDQEELTEEELTKRREIAKAKALALLEGKDDGEDGRDGEPVAYDFSKLSFGPDETERLGRQL